MLAKSVRVSALGQDVRVAARPPALAQRTVKKFLACQASSSNGATRHAEPSTRQMYVADLDMTHPTGSSAGTAQVTVPTHGGASRNGTASPPPRDAGMSLVTDRSAQLELLNANAKAELIQAKQELAERGEMVADLQSQLAERDRSLRLTKSELIETRIALQENSEGLQAAQQRLFEANAEKSAYRLELLNAERELESTQAELQQWSRGLQELRTVMDGLDEDLADLMGGDSYARVMQDVADPDGTYAGFPSVGSLGTYSDEDMDEETAISEALRGLRELSEQVLSEAREDERYFSG